MKLCTEVLEGGGGGGVCDGVWRGGVRWGGKERRGLGVCVCVCVCLFNLIGYLSESRTNCSRVAVLPGLWASIRAPGADRPGLPECGSVRVCVSAIVCVCVCVGERERDTHTEPPSPEGLSQ